MLNARLTLLGPTRQLPKNIHSSRRLYSHSAKRMHVSRMQIPDTIMREYSGCCKACFLVAVWLMTHRPSYAVDLARWRIRSSLICESLHANQFINNGP